MRTCLRLVSVVFLVMLASSSRVRADDDQPASLEDVHRLLKQAVGDSADSMPPPDQQEAILQQALKMIHHLPHVYHGALNKASRDLESALSELTAGDPAHHARADIFDADDIIKSVMD